MASTTPYKDELIRIATILGLPDDVDPTQVAEAVQALKDNCATETQGRLQAEANTAAVERMREFQRERGDDFRLALEDAATAMEKARDDLRLKAGAELVACRATMVRVADDLNLAAGVADTAAEEPAPPETDAD